MSLHQTYNVKEREIPTLRVTLFSESDLGAWFSLTASSLRCRCIAAVTSIYVGLPEPSNAFSSLFHQTVFFIG
jgi:hypothetical protein